MIIETENLKLVACDPQLLQWALEGNEVLAKNMKVTVPDNWTEFGTGALQYSFDKLSSDKEDKDWWTYFPLLKTGNKLIGSGGYKGRPDGEGRVELGYEIAPDHRNHGFATEMTRGLIEHAFKDQRVKTIIAHTLGQVNPSTKVLQKCGFKKVEEIHDPEDGLIWKWELKKD